MNKMMKKVRGASLVEYSLLLAAILLIAGAAYKLLGPKVAATATNAAGIL